MSETSTKASAAGTARVAVFASAVLLVVLLATSGWPVDAPQLREEQQVSCCEVVAEHRSFPADESEECACQVAQVRAATPPRVAPRCARVDSWGLPPPRAPTHGRG